MALGFLFCSRLTKFDFFLNISANFLHGRRVGTGVHLASVGQIIKNT